jgi:predicted Zn-dependent peptidase
MLVYRVGAADDPPGRSGLAHFLEHLMFKGTDKLAPGEFSRVISRLGGRDNAVTNQDATIYYQRVPKDRLRRVMELEADRMVNLRVTEEDVRKPASSPRSGAADRGQPDRYLERADRGGALPEPSLRHPGGFGSTRCRG